jgi:hypothetical protein
LLRDAAAQALVKTVRQAANLVRWSQVLILDGWWRSVRIAALRNHLPHTGVRIVRHAACANCVCQPPS